MADNETEVLDTETQKTDDDKTQASTDEKIDTDNAGEDTAKETKYDSDEFETESESGVPKTDEEKCAEKNKEDSPENEDTVVKTDDEKLGNDIKEEPQAEHDTMDTKQENGESLPVNSDSNTEMSEAGETKPEERSEEAEPVPQQEEQKTEQEQDDVTTQGEAEAESTNQEGDTPQDQPTAEKEPGNEAEQTVENEDKTESGPAEGDKEDNETAPVDAGPPIEKEELNAKIRENEDLSMKLESSLSNQEAERSAYKKLTDENAMLQKHHDDMKEKFEEMEGGHVVLVAEVETLRKVNNEQRETIMRLESEIKMLRESQGGDENIKDMQEKLIRLSNEQEEKDRRIHNLEGELDAAQEKLKDAESRAARGGNNTAQNSKTCVIM